MTTLGLVQLLVHAIDENAPVPNDAVTGTPVRRAGSAGRPTQPGAIAGALDRALVVVGDRWSLRLVETLLRGPRRFGELQAALPEIASSVLSQRLRHLEHQGVVLAVPYSYRPARFTYELTAAGLELAGPLRLLARWGAAHADAEGGEHEGAPFHEACGSALEVRWFCPTCEQVLEPDEPAEAHRV